MTFMDRGLEEIGLLLRKRIGLDPASLGPHGLAGAVRARLNACRLSLQEYRRFLAANEEEFQELAEEVVVGESWFFRDVAPFECLRWFVREMDPVRPVRVLSLPCGPGEETYSLAMTLLDMGMQPGEFVVEGVDLSRPILKHARAGCFGTRAFRESAAWLAPLCQRYLRPVENGYQASEELRGVVEFEQGNVADHTFLSGRTAAFEVIFCRNLLIYLAEEARDVVLANLHRLLAPNGLLYVGHTESRVTTDARFTPLNPTYPFALTRAKLAALPVRIAAPVSLESRRLATPQPAETRPQTVPVSLADLLAQAQSSADAGRLEEAAQLCEQLARERTPSAEVLCLLGVVRQASGDLAAADRLFHQALYLEPTHRESLVHLALLAERRGDTRAAAQYRRRALRAGGSEGEA